MKHKFLFIVLSFILSFSAVAQTDSLLGRYKQYLYDTIHPSGVDEFVRSYDTLKQWSDIDYNDKQPANWQVSNHLKRIRDMAVAWSNPQHGDYHNPALWRTINSALNHWLKKRYQSSNWWHNHIGVPQYMRDIIILLRDDLTVAQVSGSLEVLAQNEAYKNSTGANLVWSADLAFHYGALTGNDTLMKKCRELMLNEIKITTGEGIQPDYSFHQHYARLQMYQYGRAFLLDNIRLAWQLRGTKWSYPADKIKILVDYVLKGWQWMARGVNTVPGTVDRSVSRVGALQAADIRLFIPYLCELDPDHKQEFWALAERQNGKGKPLDGFRHYPRSDFSVYQQKDFSFFLKTISDRTLATESINNENLKGKLLHSGDAYLVKSGNEYVDLMPAWDWNLLPGITSFKGADKITRKPFVGSISDDKSGFTVMDYQLQGEKGQLISAKKMWACHKGMIVCLIGGLQSENLDGDVFTVLDQCRWRGEVRTNLSRRALPQGKHTLNGVNWIFHGGFAYIFPELSTVNIRLETVTDSWRSINASGPGTPIKENVFLPVVMHNKDSSKPVSAVYILTSCKKISDIELLLKKPVWQVLQNNNDCQAVQFNDGIIMMAFYSAGSFLLHEGKKISVDKPCVLQITKDRLLAADPVQKGQTVIVQFGNEKWNIQLPADGTCSEMIVKDKTNLKNIGAGSGN